MAVRVKTQRVLEVAMSAADVDLTADRSTFFSEMAGAAVCISDVSVPGKKQTQISVSVRQNNRKSAQIHACSLRIKQICNSLFNLG